MSGDPLSGLLRPLSAAPPSLAQPEVVFGGVCWQRCLVRNRDLTAWGAPLEGIRPEASEDSPALGISLDLARDLAHAQGGRLPRLAEWQAAVAGASPGNHGLQWGGPSEPGVFPAARSGILDGWGNAWEWTEEGLAVGGSFASPPHPAPTSTARLTSFRIVR